MNIQPFYIFTDKEQKEFLKCLENININPYKDYLNFRFFCSQLISENQVPKFSIDVCKKILNERKNNKIYVHLLRNCPIDKDRPIFDQDDPVNDKYKNKKTFIGEALLEVFSQLTEMPLLAYQTRNNGDFFHDVFAYNQYTGTQTQKTDSDLYYHNDRTAHIIRADYLVLLGMRCFERNLIYTGYIDGLEILKYLSQDTQNILCKKYFITPFDYYSCDSNLNQLISNKHSILENEHSFRYYETHTTVAEDAPIEAKDALIAIKEAIIKAHKQRVQLKNGDLLCMPNQDGLHNREIIEVNNPQEAKIRWLLKTYNFRDTRSLNRFANYYYENIPGLVRELD